MHFHHFKGFLRISLLYTRDFKLQKLSYQNLKITLHCHSVSYFCSQAQTLIFLKKDKKKKTNPPSKKLLPPQQSLEPHTNKHIEKFISSFAHTYTPKDREPLDTHNFSSRGNAAGLDSSPRLYFRNFSSARAENKEIARLLDFKVCIRGRAQKAHGALRSALSKKYRRARIGCRRCRRQRRRSSAIRGKRGGGERRRRSLYIHEGRVYVRCTEEKGGRGRHGERERKVFRGRIYCGIDGEN